MAKENRPLKKSHRQSQIIYLRGMRTLTLICIAAILASCSKDPEVIIEKEIVTVTDTVYITDTVTIVETLIQTVPDTATAYVLVRHAETMGSGSNPGLSSAGQTRAGELQRILADVPLEAVYSTNFLRTTQTAQPTASDHGLTTQFYNPSDLNGLLSQTFMQHREGTILVVGHSNTTPDLLNAMIGSDVYNNLPESEYNNLFLVYVNAPGRAHVVHMKYGN